MPYDEGLHERVQDYLESKIKFTYKKMFGGICYLINGNMLGGIINNDLIIRAGTDNCDDLLKEPFTKVFDLTGKIMKGWILVEPEGVETDDQLSYWLQKGIVFANSLQAK